MANTKPIESYFKELQEIRSTGGGTKETSYYTPLENLLNALGGKLKPKVRAVGQLADAGAGHPDFGLYAQNQFQRARDSQPMAGQIPERGVIEVKATDDDSWLTADGKQVSKYWGKYRQALVTNYRDFVLVGQDGQGNAAKLETLRLANSESDFWLRVQRPRKFAQATGERLAEYLIRVLKHSAPLATPKDLAWFLASYAREARLRIEDSPLDVLGTIRGALQDALGVNFSGERGEHFFRSTFVQTLFYGVFSAWVLWDKEHPRTDKSARFDWTMAAQFLRVPFLRKLFYLMADPGPLRSLGITEVLEWTSAALNRVDRAGFFTSFQEGEAVQYFYEPFLEAFDPALRKELGVWYTPTEIVQYMVARVDTVLREELGIDDGLADEQVYVLDPCCGTGAYLVEVLKTIANTLKDKGGDALLASDLKRAATERVLGFELLTAPFVVSHLQLGLLLQNLGAPLKDDETERVGVYLTNALTGWEPPDGPKAKLPFIEFEEERDRADEVKRERPILVILGNPPYNGYAGMAVDEERALSDAYRETKRAPKPQGQGLNDLFVRFFRMAERRIVDMTKKGVVCFISNFEWLDGLSHPGMRERYLEVFDRIWIDCLNGSKRRTGKTTPWGDPDPSVFSTESNPEGIQLGTAISLLVRHEDHHVVDEPMFRDLWGKEKRQELIGSIGKYDELLYEKLEPQIELGLPFKPGNVASSYLSWPSMPDLFPIFYPGVKTSRDEFLVDIDKKFLKNRLDEYFDPSLTNQYIRAKYSKVMTDTGRFNSEETRAYLVGRGVMEGGLVPYCYRPFDLRWVYWDSETKLLDEKRPEFFPQVGAGNDWIVSQQKPRRNWSKPQVCSSLGCLDLMDRGASCIPLRVKATGEADGLYAGQGEGEISTNLSSIAKSYLEINGGDQDSVFYHSLAALHASCYAQENAGALRQNWPRIPLPSSKKALHASAELGRELAALLNPETPVKGVTTGSIRADLKTLGLISREGGGQLDESAGDLALSAGWGFFGARNATMAGKGDAREREYEPAELNALTAAAPNLDLDADQLMELLGNTTYDIYLNQNAYWKNVPAAVWNSSGRLSSN